MQLQSHPLLVGARELVEALDARVGPRVQAPLDEPLGGNPEQPHDGDLAHLVDGPVGRAECGGDDLEAAGLCGAVQGSGAGGAPKLPPPEALERVGPGTLTDNARQWAEWLAQRGISLEVAERNGVAAQQVFSPAAGAQTNALVFPYMRDGELVRARVREPGRTHPRDRFV